MRTTLNLDDDVVETAQAMAASQHKPLSGLKRRAAEAPAAAPMERNGITLFPVSHGACAVTPEVVKELLNEVP